MNPKIIALVPMKHDSERVIGKNYRNFNGQPLFHWIIQTLANCPSISAIYINTDSETIKNTAPDMSPKVDIIDRPEHLRSGHTPMNDILLYDVEQVDADYYLQTHSTNPLLRSETIEKAIKAFLSDDSKDSLFGVTRWQTRFWSAEAIAVNHDPDHLARTQDLPPILEENSNIYIFEKEILKKKRNRIGYSPILFEIPKNEAWDIDEEIDFEIAEFFAGKLATK
jgi:CMP-N-acetylneuraminic acid synthetase